MGHSKSKMSGLRSHMLRCKNSRSLLRVLSFDGDDFNINTLVTTEEGDKATLLWLAVRYNDLDIVTHLINIGADVSQPSGPLVMTPLHVAAQNHNVTIAKTLLDAGANPNVLDRWNYTPLMYAAIHHEPDLVEQFFKVFLEHNCDVNYGACVNYDGIVELPDSNMDLMELDTTTYITYVREPLGPVSGTALHLAVQNPYLPSDTIQLLLDAGASLNRRNLYGQSPIMGAILDIYYDYHTNVKSHIEQLLLHGAGVCVRDKRGWTALHYATQRGSINCMQVLMQASADCDAIGCMGESPLWLLLILGWREAARFLISNGCDMDRPINSSVILLINQNTDVCRYGPIFPLEFAICNRFYNLAELMILAGAKINRDMWMGSCVDPPNARHVEFREFMAEFQASRVQVQSLRDYCKRCIRNVMKQSICLKVDKLCLPAILKDFIGLKEF